ncbi:MAG: glutaminase A [Bacillota bacterium]
MTSEWQRIQTKLPEWVEQSRHQYVHGKVAAYIPELSKAPADALGVVVMNGTGETVVAGDTKISFTMQSISKVFTLILALMDNGEDVVFSKVGMEPTGDRFNSMLKLELVEPGIPFNPLINAGAIAVSSLIRGNSPEEKFARVLQFFRLLTRNDTLEYDQDVYDSESATGHLNRSLAYFLMEKGILRGHVEDVLEVYFRHCAVELNCTDLARLGLVLAYNGRDPVTGVPLIPRRYVQIAKTFMTTCGMYDASGEFAIQVGLPAKSGVSGSIMTMVPGRYGIGLVGPSLNRMGNSTAGVHLLETMSRDLDWSLF